MTSAAPNTCENCGLSFPPPAHNPRRRTCSRKCAAAVSWSKGREKRIASISAAQKRRGAQIAEMNRLRWARPGERERLSQRNRDAWADPGTRARLSARIRARQSTPEMRQFYSEMRRTLWRDPAYRAKVTEIIRASHRTEEYRALFSALLRERWQDPVWREKWNAAMRRRYQKPEPAAPVVTKAVLPPVPAPPPRPGPPKSDVRLAEEAAIAAFLERKGATKLPGVGDPRLRDLPCLAFDQKTKKWSRPKVAA